MPRPNRKSVTITLSNGLFCEKEIGLVILGNSANK